MDSKNVAETIISFMKSSPAPKKTRKTKDNDNSNLAGGEVKTIQIGFELSNNQHYSGRMTNIDEDLDIQDYRNLYDGAYTLSGFSIYLS